MKKALMWRVSLLGAATAFAILFFLPSVPVFESFPSWWKRFLPAKPITLGLDLQGGMHIVLSVQGDKAIENYVDRVAGDTVDLLSQKGMTIESARREGMSGLMVKFQDATKGKDISGEVRRQYPGFSLEREEGGEVVFNLSSSEKGRQSGFLLRDHRNDCQCRQRYCSSAGSPGSQIEDPQEFGCRPEG